MHSFLCKELKSNNEKADKERAYWISQEDVMERLKELKNIIPTLGERNHGKSIQRTSKTIIVIIICSTKTKTKQGLSRYVGFQKETRIVSLYGRYKRKHG